MKRPLSTAIAAVTLFLATPIPAAPNWNQVDAALGRSGAEQGDGIRRYSFPRSDLRVRLDGVAIRPALALGSWLAFRETGDEAVVMGDLVLTHQEVNPVLSRLLEGSITITALHNHLLRSEPGTMYMHIHGHGDPVALARTIRAALMLSGTPLTAAPTQRSGEEPHRVDAPAIERILRAQGRANGGVHQFSFPRREQVKENGVAVPAAMGLATVINFQPAGPGRAVTTGDFVLTEGEVTPVLQALRRNGIDVTALHNHLTNEEPRLFFMHFWGHDEAQRLATGIRQALDQISLEEAGLRRSR